MCFDNNTTILLRLKVVFKYSIFELSSRFELSSSLTLVLPKINKALNYKNVSNIGKGLIYKLEKIIVLSKIRTVSQ